jgi:hypothetical protein
VAAALGAGVLVFVLCHLYFLSVIIYLSFP